MHRKARKASVEFCKKVSEGTTYRFKYDTILLDRQSKQLELAMKEQFSYLPFRNENTQSYYKLYSELLGAKFRDYRISIVTTKKEISELIPNYFRNNSTSIDLSRLSKQPVNQIPIVRNISKNNFPMKGLTNRNIALWQSHGWYYENTLDRWEWQRARVFLTVEDLWSMSFVVPYITPMLENAGANVFLPRERDVQTNEIIVDAEHSTLGSIYQETGKGIVSTGQAGFGFRVPFLFESENPFLMGKVQSMTARKEADATISYIPKITEAGEYAVYVAYQLDDENVTDAHYTVYHSGGRTDFLVNQTMGGGTWVYLGTFRFDTGLNPEKGSVVLSNQSSESGRRVSADAVRFGGGIGNLVRGKLQDMDKLKVLRYEQGFNLDTSIWLPFSSKRPRYQEGARYFLQYAGMPDTLVYLLNKSKVDYANRGKDAALYAKRESGKNDYKDDYQSRGEWVNYLMGAPNGPAVDPSVKGLRIPIDMAMAFHTDAGTTPDSSIIGSLMIYDTTYGPDHFPNGQSRWASRDLADLVQSQIVDDIRKIYEPEWTRRGLWNKQYSEAFRPKVPTLLSELLSHQNFADMALAQDPQFKFDVSRAFYKGILKFLSFQNGQEFVVQPLPVDHFSLSFEDKNLRLSWLPVADQLEPTAIPETYKVYTRIENGGFDNGIDVVQPTLTIENMKPGVVYSFKVTAINNGGESFASEVLSACLPVDDKKPVLIVNAFDRIGAPETFDTGKQAGFLTSEDEGVAFHSDLAFIGDQYDFNRKSPWKDDDASGFGSCHADHETKIKQGNSFDYPLVHGNAFRNNGLGFVSMSDEAFEQQNWESTDYAALDIIFGEEKTTRRIYGIQKNDFTLFTPDMMNALSKYVAKNDAKLFLSGAYIGSDLDFCGDTLARNFASNVLHFRPMTNHASKCGSVYPVNSEKDSFPASISFVQQYHPQIYKVEAPDAIEPVGENAKVVFRYSDNNKTAGICFDGNYRSLILGFPFETVTTDVERDKLIERLVEYWGIK
jgi:hypothetical protein